MDIVEKSSITVFVHFKKILYQFINFEKIVYNMHRTFSNKK